MTLMLFLTNYEMPQKKGKRNLSLLYYFVSECKQALLRAIITVRILTPHLQTIKMTEIAAHPLLLQQLPSEILPHPLEEKSAKFFFHNYSTVKVKRQKVWLSVRGNLEMSYCPTLQLLQRKTWGPFLESPPKIKPKAK